MGERATEDVIDLKYRLAEPEYPSGVVFAAAFAAVIALLFGLFNGNLLEFFDGVVIAMLGLMLMSWIGVRIARPEDMDWLPKMVALGYVAKIFWSIARFLVLEIIYHGSGDAVGYHGSGVTYVEVWRSFQIPEGFAVGTAFVDRFTGLLYVPYVPTMFGGFFIFASLAFLGQLLMYAAFRDSVKPRRLKWYAAAIFFIPAITYWPASIGKESLMFLGIGLAVYGASSLLRRGGIKPLIHMSAGLAFAGAIRPHVSALVIGSLAGALLLAKGKDGNLGMSPLVRWVSVVVVGAGSLFLVYFALAEFNINLESADVAGQVDEFVTTVEGNTAKGGSEVSGGAVSSPLDLPDATLRVLFRPLPYEAHNLQAMASALESTAFLLLIVWRLPKIIRNGFRVRSDPYVLMTMIMTLGFIVMFSPFLNLGLLARERSQILPFLAVWVIQLGWDFKKKEVVEEVEDETPPEPAPLPPLLRLPV